MPNAFDLFNYQANFDPTKGGTFVTVQDVFGSFGDVFQEIINLLPDLIKLLEGVTPSQVIQLIETGLEAFINLIFPTDGSESPILTALIAIINDAPTLVVQFVSFTLQLIPDILDALISLIGSPGGASIIGQLITVVISILPGILTSLISLITGTGGGGIIGQLVSVVIAILPQILTAVITLIEDAPAIVTQLVSVVTTILPDVLTAIISLISGGGGAGIITSLVSIVINILPQILTAVIGLLATAPSIVTQLVTVVMNILPDILTSLGSSIGGLGGAGILGQLIGIAATILTGSGGLLAGFTNSPILAQLISAAGGSGSSLTDFGNLFAIAIGDITGLATGILAWLTGGGALPGATTLGASGLTGLATGIGTWLLSGGSLPSATRALISQVLDGSANPLTGYLSNLNSGGIMQGTGITSIFGAPTTVVTVHPPVFDAVGAGASGFNTGGGWAHTLSADATALVVAVNWFDFTSSMTPPTVSVDVGSTPMTLLDTVYSYAAPGSLFGGMCLFGLMAPPTGAQTITVTFSDGTTNGVGNSLSYAGVTSFGTAVDNTIGSATTPTLSVSSGADQMVAQAFGGWVYDLSAYNQTQRFNQPYGAGLSFIMGDAPGATTVNFTASQTATIWSAAAVPLIGTSTTTPNNTSLAADLQSLVTIFAQAWGGSTAVRYLAADLTNFAQAIPYPSVQGLLGSTQIGGTVQSFADTVVQGIQNNTLTGNSFGVLGGALGALRDFLGYTTVGAPAATSVAGVGNTNNQFISQMAAAKPTASGIDQTTDAPYNIDALFAAGLPTKTITDKDAGVAFIGTVHGGVKQSVRWLGFPTGGTMANINGFFIHIWKYNPLVSTTKLTPVHQSANLAGSIGTGSSPVWNSYNLATPFTSLQNDLYVVTFSIVGSGTYNICGITGSISTAGMPQALGGKEWYGPDQTAEAHNTTTTLLTGIGSFLSATLAMDNGGDSGVIIACTAVGTQVTNFTVTVGAKTATLLGSVALGGNTSNWLGLWYCQSTPDSPIGTGNQTVKLTCNVNVTAGGGWHGAINAVNIWGAGDCTGILTASGTNANCSLALNGFANQDWNDQIYFAGASDATTWSGSGTTASPNGGFLVTASDVGGSAPLALGFNDIRFFPTITNTRTTGNSALIAVGVRINSTAAGLPVQKGLPWVNTGSHVGTSNISYDTASPWIGLSGVAGATTYNPILIPFYGSQTITNPAVTYTWANYFDCVACGGGAGGDAGGSFQGSVGGAAGSWNGAIGTRTLMGVSNITASIGTGGLGGGSISAGGASGGASTLTIPGWGPITGAGGVGHGSAVVGARPGASNPGYNFTNHYGSNDYFPGGAGGASAQAGGQQPGGGGGGGNPVSTGFNELGGQGGAGIAYIYLYQ
jgi:hypothetical protein